MKQSIDSYDTFNDLAESLGEKMGSSLQNIAIAFLNHCHADEEEQAILKISTSMMPKSYLTVPAMFARSIMLRNPYPMVQSYLRGSWMYVHAGYSKTPITFRSRAIASIKRSKIFIAEKAIVPSSYQRRPSILSSILTNATGLQVCNRCKNNKLIWYVQQSKN